MSDGKWNDSKIEETLTKLPPVKDKQSKDDLFRAIEKRSKEETPARFSPKSKRPWIVPAMATAAAIFLMILIIPPFFNGDQQFSMNESAEQNNSMDTAAVDNDMEEELAETESNMTEESSTLYDGNNADIANDEDNVDDKILESTLLNEVVYLANFYSAGNDRSDNYIVIEKQSIASEMSEEENLLTSLQESDPTSGQYLSDLEKVSAEENVVTLHFASVGSLESLASNEHQQLNEVFQEILSLYGFEEIAFEAEGEPGIIYGQDGEQESLPLSSNNRGYYLIDNEQGYFLVSARMAEEEMTDVETGDLLNFAGTVAKMAKPNGTDDWYESAIPDDINISEVSIPGTTAEVYYTIDDVDSLNEEQLQMFFHALKLSAMPFTLNNLQIINEQTGEVVEVDLRE